MEYIPPPLFKQGASARVKMTLFAFISVFLLMLDSRLHSLTTVRQVVSTALYPLQMAALVPRDAALRIGVYFAAVSDLKKEVDALKRSQIVTAQLLQQAGLRNSENSHLRQLMEASQRVPVKSMLGQILYDARDIFTRKIVLDRGSVQGVVPGLPVIDNLGVVGQVTRVFPLTSEVTLLTDKEQAIPVQVLRNGLRSVANGRGQSGMLDLRFMAPNADIKIGDVLVTSGIDGVYPAGLAVAKVVQLENNASSAFERVSCQPLSGIDRNTELLILMSRPDMPPRPPEEEVRSVKKHLGKMALLKAGPPEAVAAATTAGAAAGPAIGATVSTTASTTVGAAGSKPAVALAARVTPAAATQAQGGAR